MATALSTVAHEHHERLITHVDRMPSVGDHLGAHPSREALTELNELAAFLTGTLVPHIAAVEEALYPQLERMLQNRHSMTPMRREHEEMRQLVQDLVNLCGRFDGRDPTTGEVVSLRRSVFSLYALLKVHLAEEELYLHVVEHGVSPDTANALAAAMEHPMVAAA